MSHNRMVEHSEARGNELPSVEPNQRLTPDVEKALKNLSAKDKAVVIEAIRNESFSGPLPHPKILQGYDDVASGLAERIVQMAEREQAHRLACEEQMVRGAVNETVRGQWFGLIVAILLIGVAALLGMYGHEWLGGVIGGATIISLVTVFVTNKSPK